MIDIINDSIKTKTMLNLIQNNDNTICQELKCGESTMDVAAL